MKDIIDFTEAVKLINGAIDGSAGGIFLGGTDPANLLDDYEEGTFTPVISDAASGGNVASVGTAIGVYTKIGNFVTVSLFVLDIDTAGMTGSNDLYIQGLPFSASSDGKGSGAVILDKFTFSGLITPNVANSTAYIRLGQTVSTTGDTQLDVSAVDGTGSDIQALTVSYRTSA